MRPLSALGLNPSKGWTVTLSLVVALGVGAMLTLLFPGAIGNNLVYVPTEVLSRPWSVLLYPFAVPMWGGLLGPIWTLFLLLWTWRVGSFLEEKLEAKRFILLLLAATLVPAAILSIPGAQSALIGPFMPVSVLTVVWATRNANMPLCFMGFSVAAKWVGALSALGIFAEHYRMSIAAGFVSLIPLGIAWAWAAERIPVLPFYVKRKPTKVEAQRDIDFMKEVAKRKDARARRNEDRDETERLRRLLEGGDDPISR